jgi:hypothetical protein
MVTSDDRQNILASLQGAGQLIFKAQSKHDFNKRRTDVRFMEI